MKKLFFVALLLLSLTVAQLCASDITPFSLNLWEGVQLPGGPQSSVRGLRINLLYGVNKDVTGFDWGWFVPFNFTTGNFKGFGIGILNNVKGNAVGVQWGVVNKVDSDFKGWQNGWVNIVKGQAVGFQSGLINYTNNMRGLQLATINYVNQLYGLQIGIININKKGEPLGYPFLVLPVINLAF
ncbi:MAG TPA: hypothetical protein PLM75_00575 [bacterium]|nr:hypothetical protein [bacterium]HPP86340.1 hypothetical protein [bacterium]